MDGGGIPVKVLSQLGPALVAILATNKRSWDVVRSIGRVKEGEKAICRDLMVLIDWMAKDSYRPTYSLCLNSLSWFQVLGIFEKESCFD
jgi:hypothetical protein